MSLPFRLLLISDGGDGLGRALAAAAHRDGALAIVLRDKAVAADVVRARCEAARARWPDARLFVHGHPQLAGQLSLDGVHVADGVTPPSHAQLPGRALIGVSRHEGAILEDAALQGVDYVMLGPVFTPLSKSSHGASLGLDALRDACARAARPIVAVGGITARNAAGCFDAGAAAVAVIGAVFGADDPASALGELLDAVTPNPSSR